MASTQAMVFCLRADQSRASQLNPDLDARAFAQAIVSLATDDAHGETVCP